MTLRAMFSINVPISVLFGLSCLLFPRPLIALYGVEVTPAGAVMTQLAGAAFLAFAYLAFVGRSSASRELTRSVAVALLIQDSIGTVASLLAQAAGTFNVLGWSTVAVYALLAIGYAYCLFEAREPVDLRSG